MHVKFSQDVVTLSDLKINPGKIINHAKNSQRPVLLTSRGKGIAVVQGLEEYEKLEEERDFVKAISQGLIDIKNNKVLDLSEVKKRLNLD